MKIKNIYNSKILLEFKILYIIFMRYVHQNIHLIIYWIKNYAITLKIRKYYLKNELLE
jgi:hypothetical protein